MDSGLLKLLAVAVLIIGGWLAARGSPEAPPQRSQSEHCVGWVNGERMGC